MLYRLPLENEFPFDRAWNTLPREHGQLAVVGLDDEPRERHDRLYRAHVSCVDVMCAEGLLPIDRVADMKAYFSGTRRQGDGQLIAGPADSLIWASTLPD
jgi:hypothetical protein